MKRMIAVFMCIILTVGIMTGLSGCGKVAPERFYGYWSVARAEADGYTYDAREEEVYYMPSYYIRDDGSVTVTIGDEVTEVTWELSGKNLKVNYKPEYKFILEASGKDELVWESDGVKYYYRKK